ncbi:hypothetical protein [Massilia glaciei]|uniref:Uncharacterized protein n=1 Tax=Massilia glaciei TaxID=1524097 RepID=A0A2U2HIZ1_9BURK|nr:hypothetical protein [Massilia glaciei]PWF46818.1 hypothetical protein C7C56_015175 [Massilia glaciei]
MAVIKSEVISAVVESYVKAAQQSLANWKMLSFAYTVNVMDLSFVHAHAFVFNRSLAETLRAAKAQS